MKFNTTLFFCILFFAQAKAQYFQQKVDYKIDVKLDDQAHKISGKSEIIYTNNSRESLNEIYFHLWGNAYQSKSSAFTKQKIRTGDTKFYFAPKENMGGYEEIDFFLSNKKLDFDYDPKHKDIVTVKLNQPLPPGEQLELSIPFTLKIPDSYSRLGHVETSYQMTQWYPKPAVYDQDGWHPMPYLDMGEFYSEFGNFDVTITLPKNYVVAATGTLQTQAEKGFLEKKVRETKALIEKGFDTGIDFPESAKLSKTIRYIAENVHDFAWFADKRFHVVKDEATLKSGKKVDTWAFFTNEQADIWTRGAEYCKRAAEHYSELVGEYPWPHATAVQSALSAGAGMEYPMITVIGKATNARSLDRVITHEVGHNWFYGILANNERTHPWFDEGLNTYYENRYMEKYYQTDEIANLPDFIRKGSKMKVVELGCLYHDRRHLDQAPETHSDEFVELNYGLAAYVKPGRALRLLEKYIGKEAFDSAMKQYFNDWNMKHPQPEDFRMSLENSTGKNLSWLFDGLLYSNKKTDFVLDAINSTAEDYELKIKNRGELSTPFSVSGMKNGEAIKTVWFDGVTDRASFDFPKGDYDRIMIDADYVTLDINRKNNQIKTRGTLKKTEPIQFSFLGGIENPERSRVNWLPAPAYNIYDGFMLGAAFYSNPIPARTFEYRLAPMYGFKSQKPAGLADFGYRKYFRTSKIHRLAVDLKLKSFSYDYNKTYDQYSSYIKIAPKLTIDFRKKNPTAALQHSLSLRSVHISQEYINGIDAEKGIFEEKTDRYYVNELQYKLKNEHILHPSKLKATVQQGDGFLRAFADWNQNFRINAKGKKFQFNVFAGWLNTSDDFSAPPRVNFQINDKNGFGRQHRDYMFDELHFGRSARDTSFFYRQLFANSGTNLKTIAVTGSVEDWIIGFGVRSGIPNPIPVEPYFDIAVFEDSFEDKITLKYSGGLALVIIPDAFEIYFPIIESESITEGVFYQKNPGFFQRVSFKLDINRLDPWKIVNNFKL